jgi:hypothetical protein
VAAHHHGARVLRQARVDRADVPGAIRATAQFSSLCPDSATVMFRRLA